MFKLLKHVARLEGLYHEASKSNQPELLVGEEYNKILNYMFPDLQDVKNVTASLIMETEGYKVFIKIDSGYSLLVSKKGTHLSYRVLDFVGFSQLLECPAKASFVRYLDKALRDCMLIGKLLDYDLDNFNAMQPLTSNHSKDIVYLEMVKLLLLQSKAIRAAEACLIVKDNQIVSSGVNGTIAGSSNLCEEFASDGSLVTKNSVLHGELNALSKLLKTGTSLVGATLYCSSSPCALQCAPLIVASGISRVVFYRKYRESSGLDILKAAGVEVVYYETFDFVNKEL